MYATREVLPVRGLTELVVEVTEYQHTPPPPKMAYRAREYFQPQYDACRWKYVRRYHHVSSLPDGLTKLSGASEVLAATVTEAVYELHKLIGTPDTRLEWSMFAIPGESYLYELLPQEASHH